MGLFSKKPKFDKMKFKTRLKLTQIEIQQSTGKHENEIIQRKKELKVLLDVPREQVEAKQKQIRLKVQTITRLENTITAMEHLSHFCDSLSTRVDLMAMTEDIPVHDKSAIHSIVYAASRLPLKHMQEVRDFLVIKYSKKIITEAEGCDEVIDEITYALTPKDPSDDIFTAEKLKHYATELGIDIDYLFEEEEEEQQATSSVDSPSNNNYQGVNTQGWKAHQVNFEPDNTATLQTQQQQQYGAPTNYGAPPTTVPGPIVPQQQPVYQNQVQPQGNKYQPLNFNPNQQAQNFYPNPPAPQQGQIGVNQQYVNVGDYQVNNTNSIAQYSQPIGSQPMSNSFSKQPQQQLNNSFGQQPQQQQLNNSFGQQPQQNNFGQQPQVNAYAPHNTNTFGDMPQVVQQHDTSSLQQPPQPVDTGMLDGVDADLAAEFSKLNASSGPTPAPAFDNNNASQPVDNMTDIFSSTLNLVPTTSIGRQTPTDDNNNNNQGGDNSWDDLMS